VCTIQKTLPVIIGFTMAGMNGFGSSAEAKQTGYERQK